jgi:hypothetical protein
MSARELITQKPGPVGLTVSVLAGLFSLFVVDIIQPMHANALMNPRIPVASCE